MTAIQTALLLLRDSGFVCVQDGSRVVIAVTCVNEELATCLYETGFKAQRQEEIVLAKQAVNDNVKMMWWQLGGDQ